MLLDVSALTKEFELHGAAGKRVTACRDVSFRVWPGTCVAITGMSGAGKSTVLKCLYRTCLPTGGAIRYRTSSEQVIDLAGLPDREILALRAWDIGYVSQFLRVAPRVAALDVVVEALRDRGQSAADASGQAVSMLQRLGLGQELWDVYPAVFSGGQRQRLNIARAVVARPRLLLADEPTASLDPATQRDVVEVLRGLKQAGTAIVVALHDREVVRQLADEVLEMREGRLCVATS